MNFSAISRDGSAQNFLESQLISVKFQEDLYPDTQADIPAITAAEWSVGCFRKTLFQENSKYNPPNISLGVSLKGSNYFAPYFATPKTIFAFVVMINLLASTSSHRLEIYPQYIGIGCTCSYMHHIPCNISIAQFSWVQSEYKLWSQKNWHVRAHTIEIELNDFSKEFTKYHK